MPSGEWTAVASRGDGSAVDHAHLVTYGAAGFLAIGYRLEHSEGGPRFAEAYAWRSVDGVVWEEVAPPPLRSVPNDLWVTPSGTYVVTGLQPGDSSNKNIDVLSSVDGFTWEPANTSLPTDVQVEGVDRGALGYLLMGRRSLGADSALGLASDGLDWEVVRDLVHEGDNFDVVYRLDDIGAGDEGYVALGWRITGEVYERLAFASADGREWVDTLAPFGSEPAAYVATAVLAPLGSDWVAVVPQRDGALQVWTSANGIAWEAGGTIGTVEITSADDPVLLNVEGTLYFSLGGEALPGATGAWSSTDAETWTPLDIGEAVASDSAAGAGVVVLTGHQVADGGAGTIATIWASPAE